MKGIILSGGEGTRLRPLTRVTSKQLLPVYDKPMIYYPLNTLLRAGITEILIIVAPEHAGDYLKLLGSGREFGAKFTYEIQYKPEGLAQAFIIGENFINGDTVAMILGDNIYEDTDLITEALKKCNPMLGAKLFLKEVPDPERFGVVEFRPDGYISKITEKPAQHISDWAVTGLYVYDGNVADYAKTLTPSSRGELEITDLNNLYLRKSHIYPEFLEGEWIDAGTFESLHKASVWAKDNSHTLEWMCP